MRFRDCLSGWVGGVLSAPRPSDSEGKPTLERNQNRLAWMLRLRAPCYDGSTRWRDRPAMILTAPAYGEGRETGTKGGPFARNLTCSSDPEGTF
jgi:hypothetical protein